MKRNFFVCCVMVGLFVSTVRKLFQDRGSVLEVVGISRGHERRQKMRHLVVLAVSIVLLFDFSIGSAQSKETKAKAKSKGEVVKSIKTDEMIGIYKGPHISITLDALTASGKFDQNKMQYKGTVSVQMDSTEVTAKCSKELVNQLRGGQKVKLKKTGSDWEVIGALESESNNSSKEAQTQSSEIKTEKKIVSNLIKIGESQKLEDWSLKIIDVNKYEQSPGNFDDILRAGCNVKMAPGKYDLMPLNRKVNYYVKLSLENIKDGSNKLVFSPDKIKISNGSDHVSLPIGGALAECAIPISSAQHIQEGAITIKGTDTLNNTFILSKFPQSEAEEWSIDLANRGSVQFIIYFDTLDVPKELSWPNLMPFSLE